MGKIGVSPSFITVNLVISFTTIDLLSFIPAASIYKGIRTNRIIKDVILLIINAFLYPLWRNGQKYNIPHNYNISISDVHSSFIEFFVEIYTLSIIFREGHNSKFDNARNSL